MMDNETFNIGTLFHCDRLYEYEEAHTFETLWTQTVKGCRIVQLLQEIYHFNITYVILGVGSNRTSGDMKFLYPEFDNIDIYTRPMSLQSRVLDLGYPVQAIYNWNFGFIFRRPEDSNVLRLFYSNPFTRPLWNCLYGMAIFTSILFYLLQVWEKRVLGQVSEYGITYEMLMVVGSYCQHIPPLHAVLPSRRTAYFVFLIFSYIIYSFYTSNLLSHLVNDKNEGMDLETLTKSNVNYVITDGAKLLLEHNFSPNCKKQSFIHDKVHHFETVSIVDGLKKVKEGKTALLSDFTSLDPYMKTSFYAEELCKLVRIDLFSNIKKYFFASKNFAYKEQIKIATQRAKEVGVLKRLVNIDNKPMTNCEPPKLFQTTIVQVFMPFTTLLLSYVMSILILVGERFHYQRYRLLPYVD